MHNLLTNPDGLLLINTDHVFSIQIQENSIHLISTLSHVKPTTFKYPNRQAAIDAYSQYSKTLNMFQCKD